MSDADLIALCKIEYKKNGISSLSYQALSKHGMLYTILYMRGLKQSVLLERLGLADEYRIWKAQQPIRYGSQIRQRWSWDRVLNEVRTIQEKEGFLPPAAWMQANGHGSLIQAVYLLERTWEDLRTALDDFTTSLFVTSRNGLRWRSHAEASLSNYLHARGIEHRRGERYPAAYEKATGRAYGIYDLHFDVKQGTVDVEIWGENPNGSGEETYRLKRNQKEKFNAENPMFLGIDFRDCYSEVALTKILEKHIGIIKPLCFDRPEDKIIPSTHWSNSDELLVYCRAFANSQPDGVFPNEGWLRKRGKWATRQGPAYNTLSVYIKLWIGGIRKLRILLGQEHVSTIQWNKDRVLEHWKAFRDVQGMTPGAMLGRARLGKAIYAKELLNQASSLAAAAQKYAGGADLANEATGFKPNYRKNAAPSEESC